MPFRYEIVCHTFHCSYYAHQQLPTSCKVTSFISFLITRFPGLSFTYSYQYPYNLTVAMYGSPCDRQRLQVCHGFCSKTHAKLLCKAQVTTISLQEFPGSHLCRFSRFLRYLFGTLEARRHIPATILQSSSYLTLRALLPKLHISKY